MNGYDGTQAQTRMRVTHRFYLRLPRRMNVLTIRFPLTRRVVYKIDWGRTSIWGGGPERLLNHKRFDVSRVWAQLRHSPTPPERSRPPFGLWPLRTGLAVKAKTSKSSLGSRACCFSACAGS